MYGIYHSSKANIVYIQELPALEYRRLRWNKVERFQDISTEVHVHRSKSNHYFLVWEHWRQNS